MQWCMMQCFCILSRTCVWASRLWMVFTVFCNLHPGGEHFALWWIQLQNTFLHFWHFSFVASLYLRGCVRVTVVVFLRPDSARPPRLCLCILTLQILCSCYWTHRGCVFASCLSVHPDSADLCVRKYPPFGHAHEQHRKGSIVLVVVKKMFLSLCQFQLPKLQQITFYKALFFGQIRQPARIKSNSKQRQRQRTMICSRDVNMDKQCVRVYFDLFVYIVHHPSV